MVAVDSNYLLRFLVSDVTSQTAEATAYLETAKPGSIVLDRLILAEISYVLRAVYGYERARIVQNIQSLYAAKCFFILDKALVGQMVQNFASYPRLDMEDCWLLAQQQRSEVGKVLTFDQALAKHLA